MNSILAKSLTLNAVFTQGRGPMSSHTFEEFHPVRSTQRLRLASFLSLHKLLQRKLCYDGLDFGHKKGLFVTHSFYSTLLAGNSNSDWFTLVYRWQQRKVSWLMWNVSRAKTKTKQPKNSRVELFLTSKCSDRKWGQFEPRRGRIRVKLLKTVTRHGSAALCEDGV